MHTAFEHARPPSGRGALSARSYTQLSRSLHTSSAQIKELRRSLANATDEIAALEEELQNKSSMSTKGGSAREHLSLGFSHVGHALRMALSLPAATKKKVRKNSSLGRGGTLPMEDWQEFGGTCLFFPVGAFKETWDTFVMFLILYSAVTVPFRVCFGAEVRRT